jgi:hypothetical protein
LLARQWPAGRSDVEENWLDETNGKIKISNNWLQGEEEFLRS